MKKVFVTGADGLLGANVVRELLNRGYQVTTMIQPGHKAPTLDDLDIEKVEADLLDREKIIQITADSNIIIHIAAITNLWPSRGMIYHQVNVKGTQHVVEAALAHQVDRMIHVGTANSCGFGSLETPGTEEDISTFDQYGLDYIDSKLKGEEIVLEATINYGLNGVIVNPTFLMGPYDAKPSSGKLILEVAKGHIIGFAPGGKCWAAVKDVAVAICNAITMGRIGERYILGGENLPYKVAMKQIFEVVGRKAPLVTIPAFFVKLAGIIGSLISRITRKAPRMSYPMAQIASAEHYFSSAKAIKELNMPQTPLREALEEAWAWLKTNGYMDK